MKQKFRIVELESTESLAETLQISNSKNLMD